MYTFPKNAETPAVDQESGSDICHIHKESQHNRQNRHRILESIRSSVAHWIMKTSVLIGSTMKVAYYFYCCCANNKKIKIILQYPFRITFTFFQGNQSATNITHFYNNTKNFRINKDN